MKRWAVPTVVILTVLLCLGTVSYIGHVWWAKKTAAELFASLTSSDTPDGVPLIMDRTFFSEELKLHFKVWRTTPWYGGLLTAGKAHRWWPRRSYHEFFVQLTEQDLGDDPDTWEAWFKAHPNLVWDEKLKRLVDQPVTSP